MMANILIVDDQQCVREFISEELTFEGHRVDGVWDVESVRGHLRFSQPDLVLLDLFLDGADGFGVFDEIKRQRPNVPVIIFTAYDSYREEPRLSRADGYVIKSTVLDELKGKIAEVLGRQEAPEAAAETELSGPELCAADGI
jgi:DNA-binding response OmpR family regulator